MSLLKEFRLKDSPKKVQEFIEELGEKNDIYCLVCDGKVARFVYWDTNTNRQMKGKKPPGKSGIKVTVLPITSGDIYSVEVSKSTKTEEKE